MPERAVDAAERVLGRLARLPVFVPGDYLAANPDVAAIGADPLQHAASWGVREHRPVLSEIAAARAYARPSAAGSPATPAGGRLPARCTVFVHSSSHEGYQELAAALAADLDRAGVAARVSDERADHRAPHGTALFVAPHDFFVLGRGPLWRDPEILGRGIAVLDDPIGAPALERSLGTALAAFGILDTSAVGTSVWGAAGIPTALLRPRVPLRSRWLDQHDLAHPLMRAAPAGARRLDAAPLEPADRPIDLLFFAPEASRRNVALGRLAPALARHRCYVYAQQAARTAIEQRVYRRGHWRIAGHLGAHARLTLNLSEGPLPVLDRRRVVERAMAGGSVVVSDARFAEPGLDAGVHYLAGETRHLGELIDWALLDPDGRAAVDRMRERAFDHVAALNGDARRLDGALGLLADAAEEAGR